MTTTTNHNHPHARCRRRNRSHPQPATTRYRPRPTTPHRRHTTPQHNKPQTTPPPPQPPLAYNPTQAAKLLGISRTLLYEEMNRGHIHARKLGRRTLITHTELQRYLADLPLAQ